MNSPGDLASWIIPVQGVRGETMSSHVDDLFSAFVLQPHQVKDSEMVEAVKTKFKIGKLQKGNPKLETQETIHLLGLDLIDRDLYWEVNGDDKLVPLLGLQVDLQNYASICGSLGWLACHCLPTISRPLAALPKSELLVEDEHMDELQAMLTKLRIEYERKEVPWLRVHTVSSS